MSTTVSNSILERVADGDGEAFRECTTQYSGLVWSLSRRMCPTRQDAEDAVQDIFLEVWKSAGRYDSDQGSEATFIATIARRRLIDRLRKQGRRPDTGVLIEGSAPETDLADSQGESVEMSEDSKRARAALKQLSQEQQRVLQLAIFHGLSHDKISTSTGLPLGTVKAHIRRGLIRLREILSEEQSKAPGGRGRTEVS